MKELGRAKGIKKQQIQLLTWLLTGYGSTGKSFVLLEPLYPPY